MGWDEVWDEITPSFPNLNSWTIAVGKLKIDFILHSVGNYLYEHLP